MIVSIIRFVVLVLGTTGSGENIAYVQQMHGGNPVGELVRIQPAPLAWYLRDTIEARTYVLGDTVWTDTTIIPYRYRP